MLGIHTSHVNTSCKNRHAVHQASQVHPGRESIIWKDCGSWACPACARRLRERWGGKIIDTLDDTPIYVYRCSAAEWSSRIQRKIRRAGGSAYRLRVGNDVVALTDWPIDGSVPLDADNRAAFVGQLLDTIPLRKGKPLTACGEWLPPRVPRLPNVDQMTVVGTGPITPEQAVAVCAEFGVPLLGAKTTGPAPKLTWEVPIWWTDAQRHDFRRHLHSCRVFVRAKPMNTGVRMDSTDKEGSTDHFRQAG